MSTNKDEILVDYLVNSTMNGTIRWSPSGDDKFTAPLRGDHTATIEWNNAGPNHLYLRNREGEVILELHGDDYNSIESLFQLARRNAYNIDKVIDEIIGEQPKAKSEGDEDIPF